MTFIQDGNADVTADGSLNIEKVRLVGQTMSEFLLYQKKEQPELQVDDAGKQFLESVLSTTVPSDPDEYLYQKSLERRPL